MIPEHLLILELSLVIVADVIAFFIVFRKYLQTKRTSLLAFSLAWIFDSMFVVGTILRTGFLETLALPGFSALMFYGAIRFLEEESVSIKHSSLEKIAVMPLIFVVFIELVYLYTKNAYWTATMAVSLGISGVFVIGAGILMWELREIYLEAIKYLSLGVVLFGFHLIPAAFFGMEPWYFPIGVTLSASLILVMAWSMLKLVRREEFKPSDLPKNVEVKLNSGVLLVGEREFKNLKKQLVGIPVLAFVREIAQVPRSWISYFVTSIPLDSDRKVIAPTELSKITEIIYRYLENANSTNGKPVILIESLEYLSVYNSWESLLKFLSKLRDLVIVNNGTMIVIVEKESLEDRLYAQLKKLME